MKKRLKLYCIMSMVLMLSGCYDRYPQERLGMVVGLGYDIERKGPNVEYKNISETFTFEDQEIIEHIAISATGSTIYSVMDELQGSFGKKWILGSELVYLIHEDRATYGIKDLLDSLMRDVDRRRTAVVAVTKQSAEDIFNLNPKLYSTKGEDINGVLRLGWQENFFSRKVQVSDILQMYHQEGREIIVPYIEIIEDRTKISGLALFNRDKMIGKVNLEEAKLINLIRNSRSNGYLQIHSDNNNEYYEGYFENKRKVKVSKEGNKFKYSIFVNLNGDLKVNTIHTKAITKKEIKEMEKVFSEKLRSELKNEVKKVQEVYKADWLDLGQCAVAKYGRNNNYASDESFSNAIIDIFVDVKINAIGGKTE